MVDKNYVQNYGMGMDDVGWKNSMEMGRSGWLITMWDN
jgi:hypothetical protein